ncbi:hypothetical protein GCM10009596_16060 [Arthrobacter rhombi]|uniref:ribbon-helix-helix protein, CopG family n=1 Tax=Arthrobacter rhombi TaxID=71253 RepID=UPI0031DEA2BD
MTSNANEAYEALADRAERGELPAVPGTAWRGTAESRAEAARLLMGATGTEDVQEAIRVGVGRPKVGAGAGPSPVVRARVPEELKARVTALAAREHLKESDIVREALSEYVSTRQLV